MRPRTVVGVICGIEEMFFWDVWCARAFREGRAWRVYVVSLVVVFGDRAIILERNVQKGHFGDSEVMGVMTLPCFSVIGVVKMVEKLMV